MGGAYVVNSGSKSVAAPHSSVDNKGRGHRENWIPAVSSDTPSLSHAYCVSGDNRYGWGLHRELPGDVQCRTFGCWLPGQCVASQVSPLVTADRLASEATLTSDFLFGRSEVLRSLRHYLQAQGQGHQTTDHPEEGGMERGSARRSSLKG